MLPRWTRSCLAILAAGVVGVAFAQPFPARPVRIVVPFPPGGPSDYAARIVSAKLAESLGQPVIVDNRAGAGGALGAELVARAAPDGYTLLIANTGMLTILPHLKTLVFDPQRDFTAVTDLIGGPSFLLVHPSVPARSVRELIALAKRQPGTISCASAGVGQISHMNLELLQQLAGIRLLHVPYKGTGAVTPELIGGQVMITFSTSADNLQMVKAGRVRLLAVTGKKRLPMLADTPTMAEAGVPGFDSLNWNGIVGAAHMPRAVTERLNRELVNAIKSPDVVEKVSAQGNFVIGDTPEQFGAYIRAESEKWARVVKQGNIKLD
jgi:tripartite-type tricarboxylate transporter receptor subunit TctC